MQTPLIYPNNKPNCNPDFDLLTSGSVRAERRLLIADAFNIYVRCRLLSKYGEWHGRQAIQHRLSPLAAYHNGHPSTVIIFDIFDVDCTVRAAETVFLPTLVLIVGIVFVLDRHTNKLLTDTTESPNYATASPAGVSITRIKRNNNRSTAIRTRKCRSSFCCQETEATGITLKMIVPRHNFRQWYFADSSLKTARQTLLSDTLLHNRLWCDITSVI